MSQTWWRIAGSNRRPPDCNSGALPAELWPHKKEKHVQLFVEIPTFQNWWVWEDLNFRPHPYQGCALTS